MTRHNNQRKGSVIAIANVLPPPAWVVAFIRYTVTKYQSMRMNSTTSSARIVSTSDTCSRKPRAPSESITMNMTTMAEGSHNQASEAQA